MILPQFSLSKTQKEQVIERTNAYIKIACKSLNINLVSIDVRFDLSGKSSGMFVVRQGKAYIRYNEIIFSSYFEDSITHTVAHEVAHYVVYSMHKWNRVKPHGAEWQSVMAMFGVPADVTSKYDISLLPLKQQRRHGYVCDCMSHQLSTTRHNKVQNKKTVYHCKKCMQPLRYVR